MISYFYRAHSKTLLLFLALTFPLLALYAETIPSNNDIETWLPANTQVRATYEYFRRHFGAEDVVLIGLSGDALKDGLPDILSRRVARLRSISDCWSPSRFREFLKSVDVEDDQILARQTGLLRSAAGDVIGLVATLNDRGLNNRSATVADIRDQIRYCQLADDDVHLAGSSVVVSELNRLGDRKNNQVLFVANLLVAFLLLVVILRDVRLSACILVLNLWAIELSLSFVKLMVGEMNFILDALSVMVMIFTITICIHFVHYYRSSLHLPDPLSVAFSLAFKPCVLSVLTTTIGLASLCISDIGPVRTFGFGAAVGSVVSLLVGLFVTPAVLCVLPITVPGKDRLHSSFMSFTTLLFANIRGTRIVAFVCIVVTACGLPLLASHLNPVDFLPTNSRVLSDYHTVNQQLTGTTSVEAMVDFSDDDLPFVSKLEFVRALESRLLMHPAICSTMSAGTFLPAIIPDNPFELGALLDRVSQNSTRNTFVADGDNLWRVSCRIRSDLTKTTPELLASLTSAADSSRVTFTGQGPLLTYAQSRIFSALVESFATAFAVITIIMMISLRSLKTGFAAMIPNLAPLCLVFGALGLLGIPIGIGMMMTASIALGIAVDGTFHYLLRYRLASSNSVCDPALTALQQTGLPILVASFVAAVGMLSLTFSRFQPTVMFGYMMAVLLVAAVIGDLVLLPIVLAVRPKQFLDHPLRPHFASSPYCPVHAPTPLHLSTKCP